MPVVRDASLVTREKGKTYQLSRVRVHDSDKLQYLGELGLYPGVNFSLLSFAPFNGPVRILMGRDEMVFSYELAAALFVEES
jgi:Fe2+ transport system protein FeoA